jgi:hypothetical protein
VRILGGVLFIVLFIATACGTTRTRTVVRDRPPIRDGATVRQVRANFAGAPFQEGESADGYDCRLYVQDPSEDSPTVGGWVVRACYRQVPS